MNYPTLFKRQGDYMQPEEQLMMQKEFGVGDVDSTEKGSAARYNGGKPDYSLIPMWTLADEARAWAYGETKYNAWNWTKGMLWSIPFACAHRHLAAWQAGEDIDKDSGQTHLALAMCNLRMLTFYATQYPQGDNRLKGITL
jgi:hypothetical protein